MVFLEILEVALVILFAAFVVLQIIVPAVLGKPVFPMFRHSVKKMLEEELAHARIRVDEANLQNRVKALEDEATKLKEEVQPEEETENV